jgi:hypothetical protein
MLATYVSATQFTVVGDQTTIFVTNRRVKCDCGVDGLKYGTISTSAYTTLTTVTLTAESDDLTANLTDVEWSVQIPIAVPVHNHTNESTGGDLDLGSTYELIGEIDQIPIDNSHKADNSVLLYDVVSGTFGYIDLDTLYEKIGEINQIPIDSSHFGDAKVLMYDAVGGTFDYVDLDTLYEKVGRIDNGIPIDSSHIADGTILRYEASSGTFVYSDTGAIQERFVNITGAKNANSSTTYLNGQDGTAMNLVPFTIPFDCELKSMSLSANVAKAWTAEVHVSLVLKVGATLASGGAATAYDNTYTGIYFSAGDLLELYMNGTNVSRPRIDVVLRTY